MYLDLQIFTKNQESLFYNNLDVSNEFMIW